jgi:hypothetical protein
MEGIQAMRSTCLLAPRRAPCRWQSDSRRTLSALRAGSLPLRSLPSFSAHAASAFKSALLALSTPSKSKASRFRMLAISSVCASAGTALQLGRTRAYSRGSAPKAATFAFGPERVSKFNSGSARMGTYSSS